MVTEKDSEIYKMNHPNRGKCVVFNHEIFDNNANREGSSNDARKIKETFEKLGFQVIILNNLKHSEVIQSIDNRKLNFTSIHFSHFSHENLL